MGGNNKPPYTKEKFLKRAVEKFGDKFDYSLVEYVNMRTMVDIICPIHGEFNTTPNAFLQSYNGCKKCGKIVRDTKNTSNKDEFVSKAISKFGNKFDYSLVKYINSYTNVEIICKEHGSFFQRPDNHINSKSICPTCSRENVSNQKRLIKKSKPIKKSLATKKCERHFKEYVDKCNLKFKNRFDYSNAKYINNRSELEIICKLHGKFFQKANYHYKSRYGGCVNCAKNQEIEKYKKPINSWTYTQWEDISKISKVFNEFICYIIKCSNIDETFYKIGKTFKKIKIRFYRKSDMPYNYEVIKIFKGDSRKISELEHLLQNMSKDSKYIPNISFKGMYECFSDLNENVLNYEFLN